MTKDAPGQPKPAPAAATAPATPPTPRAGFRVEKDPLGYLEVPESAYYGVQTARGIHNFPISGARPHPALVRAIVQVKKAAARANMATGRLPKQLGNAIVEAADEVLAAAGETVDESDGFEPKRSSDPMHAAFEAARAAKQADLVDNFRIDPFQAGAGTSHNMNANEVLANRAIELLHAQGVGSGKRGDYAVCSPNDHVNMAQSTNDVFPTSMRIATLDLIRDFIPAANELVRAFEGKAREFDDVIKAGRTHMQDAVPVRLGQEFAAYALTLRRGIDRLATAADSIAEQNIGATAVGTGLNAEPEYIELVVRFLAEQTGHNLRGAEHLVQATHSMRPMLEVSAALRGIAVDLIKISEDLRLMSSGPMTGFAEITLPAVQPGSSIMPGKVNPVICEAMMMVCGQVIANDLAVTIGNERGNFQLNVMLPLIARNLLESITILGNAARALADKAVAGFTVNRERIADLLDKNPILVTSLNPVIGYDKAAKLAKQAYAEGRRLKDLVVEQTGLTMEEAEKILDPKKMTQGGIMEK
jgi:aspartate ammonia-lyase